MGKVDHAGLIDLWDEIRVDPAFSHLRQPGIHLVPGYGAERPLAMVVGEAPGATENERGEPFCGASGQVLHQLMALAGLYAKRVSGLAKGDEPFRYKNPNIWLTNAIKFRPPGNRTPNVLETLRAKPYLLQEWRLIGRPRLIVCVGNAAANTLMVHQVGAMRRGELYQTRDRKTYICYQYHPAYGLRNPKAQPVMERQWELMGEMIQEMKERLRWKP